MIREISGTDDLGCTKKCAKHPRCKSYNIHYNRKICQLNDKMAGDIGMKLTVNSGWTYKATNYNEKLVRN